MRAWRKVMAACLRVYDSCHLLADCKKPNPTLGSRVWTTFNFFTGARSTSPTDIDRQLQVPCCRRSAANRTPLLLLLSINGTDGRTDVWPLHETCCAHYICMHTSLYGSRIGSRILQGLVSNPSDRGAGSQTFSRHFIFSNMKQRQEISSSTINIAIVIIAEKGT